MHQGNRHNGDTTIGRKRQVLPRRSSFGGEYFHDSSSNTNTVQHGQISEHRYSVIGDGHAYGAHSGEYLEKESNNYIRPNQRHRRTNQK